MVEQPAAGASHVESAENVEGMRPREQPTRRGTDVREGHTLCVASGALLVGFLIGYFVGAHRQEIADRW